MLLTIVSIATIFLFGVLCGLRLAKRLDRAARHQEPPHDDQ
jgi:hypothetical protein